MQTDLDTLSSADRGFLTWLAAMARTPLPDLWARLFDGSSTSGGNGIADGHLVRLDLSGLGHALRWAAGPERRLTLPLAGLDALRSLDVSGLDLDALDLRLLPELQELRCADNRLSELELGESRALRKLDCCGNQLMVLDLRANPALEEVRCSGNGLGVLVLPDARDRLRFLDCSRNQLMVLEVGDRSALEELHAFRNALVRFDIGAAPALKILDLGRNDLDHLPARVLPALRSLSVGRNKLAELDLGGWRALRELRCHLNYLAALDVTPCPELDWLDAHGNQLEALRLGGDGVAPVLSELRISDNRLTSLDPTTVPGLVVLRAAGNRLGALALANPALVALDVADNELDGLELAGAPALVELRCFGNTMRRLDVSACPDLARLEVCDRDGRAPDVVATDEQRRRLKELRELAGLGTGAVEPEQMDTFELHDLACAIHGRDTEGQLLRIVRAPACDLGTALMVYWTSSPHYYLRYASRDEVADYELAGWDLLEAIEQRVAAGGFGVRRIPFDPRHDRRTKSVRGVDWTVDDRIVRHPQRRRLPEVLLRA